MTLGQLQRIQITSTSAIFFHDIWISVGIVVALATSMSFRSAVVRTVKQILTRKYVALVGWLLIGLLGAAFQQQNISPSILYLGRLSLYGAFGLLVWSLIKEKFLTQREVFGGLILSGVAVLYFGFLQYFFMPDMRWLFFLGWDDHYYRLLSTLLDPGFVGILFILTFCAVQTLFLRNYLKVCISAMFMLGILLTYSRATYVAFLTVCILGSLHSWWCGRKGKGVVLVAYVVCFLFSLPFLPHPGGEGVRLERTASVHARTENITSAVSTMKPVDWVIGKGIFMPLRPSVTEFAQPDHARLPDNWIVFILTGMGVVGLALFLISVGKIFIEFYRKNVWLALSVFAVLVHGLFNATIVYPFVVLFMLMFAVSSPKTNYEK